MIDLAIFDEHNLVLQGLSRMIAGITDCRIVFACNNRAVLAEKLKSIRVNVLILNLHDTSVRNLNLIVQLKITNPGLKILVLSAVEGEEIILKTIKAGAKGFLGKDSAINDLTEAIYTIRNGHDYFSNSITRLLLNRYISKLDTRDDADDPTAGQLSARQIEILRLWGESYSNHEIAERLFISIRTVETHKNHIMQKLNLKSTVDMVKFAIKNNIINV
jgi:DNA-binding NarL/FixJ family response regulator